MAGPRKAKHDIAPMLRHAFIKGMAKVARDRGLTVPELMAVWIKEDWKAVLTAMGRYTVREATVTGKVEHDHKHQHTHESVSDTAAWVAGFVGDGPEEQAPESLPH